MVAEPNPRGQSQAADPHAGQVGASLANIADELGLTKQALLHHLGRKEKLYAEIPAWISSRMLAELHPGAHLRGA